jgi:DNA-binding IclR family transcriptional regulator
LRRSLLVGACGPDAETRAGRMERVCNAPGAKKVLPMIQSAQSSTRAGGQRGLSAARSALRVLALLVDRPEGLRATEVAEAVGKSVSTAYYLLDSLSEEGFAVRDPATGTFRLARYPYGHYESEDQSVGVARGLDELHLRTHKRSYLAVVRHGAIEIAGVRGRQGMPKVEGLGTRITDAAHALALGKVVLALLPEPARRRYAARGLKAFTHATVTSPDELMAELREVRHNGYAVDREEFAIDFCSVAAPMLAPNGRFVAALGVSARTKAFDEERSRLISVVRGVASNDAQKTTDFLRIGA